MDESNEYQSFDHQSEEYRDESPGEMGEDTAAPAHTDNPTSSESTPATDDVGHQVLDIIADVEGRLSRLRQVSKDSSTSLETIRAQQETIRKQQTELEQAATEVEKHRSELEHDRSQVTKREEQVESWCAMIDKERTELQEQQEKLATEQADIRDQTEKIQSAADQLEQRRGELDREAEQYKRQQAELEQEFNAKKEEIENRLTAANQQHEQCLGQRDETITSLEKQAEESRGELEQARKQVESERTELRQVQEAVELLTVEIKSVRHDLEQKQHDLTEAQQSLDELREELERRDYERTLHDEQCETAKAKINRLTQENEQAGERNRQHEDQLSRAKDKLTELVLAMESQTEQLEAGAEAIAALQVSHDEQQRLSEANQQLSLELENAKTRLEGLKEGTSSSESAVELTENQVVVEINEITERDKAIELMTERIKGLENDLEQAREDLKITPTVSGDEDDEVHEFMHGLGMTGPKFQEERLALARRRERLNRQRQLLREKAQTQTTSDHPALADQLSDLRNDQQMLVDVRSNLEVAERKMIHKWAHSHALTRMFWFVLTVMVLAAGSYFGVMQFWPLTYTASAMIEAQSRPGFPMTEAQIGTWQTVHEEMVYSEAVVSATAERLRQRGYKDLSRPDALNAYLGDHLAIASAAPGSITFNLSAPGQADVQRILETYTMAYVSSDRADQRRRTDGGMTKLIIPATVDPVPVDQQAQLQYSAMVFGGSLVFVTCAGLLIYLRLRRHDGVLETADDDDLFEPLNDESNWAENEVKPQIVIN